LNQTYIFMVANKLNLDTSQLGQSHELGAPKALVDLGQSDQIVRHGE
jgi:hypothetical protein